MGRAVCAAALGCLSCASDGFCLSAFFRDSMTSARDSDALRDVTLGLRHEVSPTADNSYSKQEGKLVILQTVTAVTSTTASRSLEE